MQRIIKERIFDEIGEFHQIYNGRIFSKGNLKIELDPNEMANIDVDSTESLSSRIFNSLSIMLLVLDDKGVAIDCNSAFRKYLKKPKQNIIGKLLLEIIYSIGIYPESNNLNTLELTRRRQSIEVEVGNKILKITADPVLDRNKNIKNIIVIITDITERKNSLAELEDREKKYKNLVELSSIGITKEDKKAKLIYFNNQFATLFGYTEEEINKLPRKRLIHPDDLHRITVIQRNRMMGKNETDRFEYRGIKKNGEIVFIDASVSDIFDSMGNIIGTQSYLRDISERKKTIFELEIALEKAKESDRLKTAFIANMSHEIRTPLNGIMGFTKLLENENISKEDGKNYIKIINSCSDQLLKIIWDILEISKIETNQIEINKTSFDIESFLNSVSDKYKKQFELKNIVFNVSIDNPKSIKAIYSDKRKLNRIINNLLDNALKFTTKGRVELNCLIKDKYFEFSIIDTGIGIEQSLHEKIFEQFRQADFDFTKKYYGNGLGLSICKGYVQAMGGRIWLESKINMGTTMYFKIPNNI